MKFVKVETDRADKGELKSRLLWVGSPAVGHFPDLQMYNGIDILAGWTLALRNS